MGGPELRAELSLDPSSEECQMHSTQVWLHGARRVGVDELGIPRRASWTVKDADGKVVGGLLARLQMKVLYIDAAWVDPAYQRMGAGARLREKVFAFARENGCEYLLATTYQFYDAIDYLAKTDPEVEVLAKIENCPAPHTLVFLKRKL